LSRGLRTWLGFYESLNLVPLYPESKRPIYSPVGDFKDPDNLHARFKTETDYLAWPLTNDCVLHQHFDRGYNVGALTGPQRDGRFLVVMDFDVKTKRDISAKEAREWRSNNLSKLRESNTRVSFTPNGGFHLWFYGSVKQAEAYVLRRLPDLIPLRDLTRASGGMVVVEPSQIPEGVYFYLDNGKTTILDVLNEPAYASRLKLDAVDEFLSPLRRNNHVQEVRD